MSMYPLTKELAVERHRELWNKCVELIERGIKYDYKDVEHYSFVDELKRLALIELGYNPDEIDLFCWCCEYTWQKHKGVSCEKVCPIIWDETDTECVSCCSKNSPFRKFMFSENVEDRLKYAKQIANLPIREDK